MPASARSISQQQQNQQQRQWRATQVIRQEIQQVESQLFAIQPPASLPTLEKRVLELTTRCLVDEARREELRQAVATRDKARENKAAYDALTTRKRNLLDELHEATIDEAAAIRADAAARITTAHNEFVAHARAAARAYGRMVATARQCGYTQPLPVFDASPLRPVSWQGTTGSMIADGSLTFEDA
jgi:hypothetical protein